MTKCRPWGVIVLVAFLSSVALHTQPATADSSVFRGVATYLITISNATGAFVSRVVITLHSDHTLSVIDSEQGGPTFFFTPNWARGATATRAAWSGGRSISTSHRPQM